MRERFVCCLAIAAACGGKPAKPATPAVANANAPATAASYPAPLYAGLFVTGNTFRYDVVSSTSYPDDADPRADAYGNVNEETRREMTCTVIEVEPLASGMFSTVDCDGGTGVPVSPSDPGGMYVANKDGLWRVESIAAARAGTLVPDALVIAADPVETRTDLPDGSTHVDRDHDGWCTSYSFSSGDDGGTTMCFAHGAVVFGSALWAGGSSREATYSLVE